MKLKPNRVVQDHIITHKCLLNCAFCPVSSEHEKEFNCVPQVNSLVYNLIGGDPLLESAVAPLLQDLRHKTKIINIFSPLQEIKVSPTALRTTSIYTYLLSTEADEHNELTGRKNSFEQTLRNIKYLKSYDISPIVLFWATRQTAQNLPDIHQFCLKNKLRLWIEIPQNFCDMSFSQEEIKNLRYFARTPHHAFHVDETYRSKGTCLYVPQVPAGFEQIKYFLQLIKISR